MKFFISPSSQTKNTYAVGNTNEHVQMTILADLLTTNLTRCGIEVVRNDALKPDQRPAFANSIGCNGYLSLHSNSYNGLTRGARLFMANVYSQYKNTVAGSRWLMQKIAKYINTLSMQPAIKTYTDFENWFELAQVNCSVTYLEAFFHDNVDDCNWWFANKERYAEALAKGICEAYNISYVPAAPTVNTQLEIEGLKGTITALKTENAQLTAKLEAIKKIVL